MSFDLESIGVGEARRRCDAIGVELSVEVFEDETIVSVSFRAPNGKRYGDSLMLERKQLRKENAPILRAALMLLVDTAVNFVHKKQ
jgi:hypothetical protein